MTIANDSNAGAIKSAIDAAGITGITTSVSGSTITISNANGNVNFTGSTGALLTSLGLSTSTNYAPAVTGAVKTVDQLVTAINGTLRSERQGRRLERRRQAAHPESLDDGPDRRRRKRDHEHARWLGQHGLGRRQ